MGVIASRANSQFKRLRLLAGSARDRRRLGLMLLDGPHLVASALEHGLAPETIVLAESAREHPEIVRLIANVKAPIVELSDPLFAQVAPVDTPTGILAVVPISSAPGTHRLGDCLVVLDGIQDPGNVGSIIRTAAAAGATDVLLSRDCADPWSPRTLRAGMGGHFVLRVHSSIDLPAVLEGYEGVVVATVARGGVLPQTADLTGRTAFLFGSEGRGLNVDTCPDNSVHVTIPMMPGVESLNVGAAAAVLLFERVRQIGQAKAHPNRE